MLFSRFIKLASIHPGIADGPYRKKMSQPIESTWAYRELLRIDALQDAELIHELCRLMNGHTYSWKRIHDCLSCLDANDILHLDWQDLCSLKETWDSFPSLTRERQHQDIMPGLSLALGNPSWDPRPFRTLLLNLRLILVRAGFDEEQGMRHATFSKPQLRV